MLLIRNRFLILLLLPITCLAQIGTNGADRSEEGRPIVEYNLTVAKGEVTLAGVTSKGMTINGSIPGPTIELTEGDLAVINVTNNMDVETSVHWHGLILPNFYDGVPYLTTPPIKPGTTFQYRIPINQSGTYWYHSHTMLQEQQGVYGSIVIRPKQQKLEYDKELVVVLSDWTNQKAHNVLRNLKRGNEWFQVKKGTAVPLSMAIAQGGFGAQLKMWRDRMEGADIADIYYPAFLSNGQGIANYPDFKPGEKVRLRFINASSSTIFWLDFGGGKPMLVSSDGVDVTPVMKDRLLFTIAETYDFIVTIPDGQLEIAATAQDGSGHTSIRLGEGLLKPAFVMDRPDKVDMMKQMADTDMKMGAPAITHKLTPEQLDQKFGMKMSMDGSMEMKDMDHSQMKMDAMPMESKMEMGKPQQEDFDYNTRKTYFNYDFLMAEDNTTLPADAPVNEMLLNLTGNMNRYIWSINGRPLAEDDKIEIKGGEVTRITFNNLTMMHHPMHLHGHYFRVVNKNGERSPLKHTVNVPPMQKVTIEFYNEEEGDWFFHCHVLYHMMGGMARVASYGTTRDPRLKDFPYQDIIKETNPYFSWGTAQIGSNFSEMALISSSLRNEFSLTAEYDYDERMEAEFSYNRYLYDWVRIYAGAKLETENGEGFSVPNLTGKVGLKYFTPYMFYVDLSIDHQIRPEISVTKEFMLFPRTFVEGEYSYIADFGAVNNLESGKQVAGETEWKAGLEYMISKSFSLMANYHNHYGAGGGLTVRF